MQEVGLTHAREPGCSIRARRTQAGLSLGELAALAGVSVAALSGHELGREPLDDDDAARVSAELDRARDKGKAARAEVERLRAGIALVLVSIDDARRLEGDGTVGRQILAGLLAEVPR